MATLKNMPIVEIIQCYMLYAYCLALCVWINDKSNGLDYMKFVISSVYKTPYSSSFFRICLLNDSKKGGSVVCVGKVYVVNDMANKYRKKKKKCYALPPIIIMVDLLSMTAKQ